MLDYLPTLRTAPPRALPKYHLFLNEQNKYIIRRHRRSFGELGHTSAGIDKLIYLLQFIDFEYLDRQIDNFDRYYYHLRLVRRDLLNTFDKVQQGTAYKNLFFKNKSGIVTQEYLLPIEDLNTVVHLPLFTNDWSEWRKVRTLRIWSHDGKVPTTNILNDRVMYTQPPTYAIETLDVIALLLKFYIWRKYQMYLEPNQDLVQHVPKQYFLHKYVMCDVLWDLGNIWIENMLSEMITCPSKEDFERKLETTQADRDVQYEYLVGTYKQGFMDVWNLFNQVRDTTKPATLLNTRLYLNGSIMDRIVIATERLPLPIHARYDYFRYLRDETVFNLVCGIMKTRKVLPETRSMFVSLERDYKRLIDARPWLICNSKYMQSTIENKIVTTTEMIVDILNKK